MLHSFSGVVDGREVHVIYEGEDRPVYLMSRLIVADHTAVDEVFGNLRQASAVLRGELGYGPAYRVLEQSGIPRTSQMWHLNHDGPPGLN